MGTIRMTEKEVIEFTIAKGFKGEEFETQAWKQRSCLRTDGTFKKLINKLECYFESVLVEGKGKKKIFILSEPKVEVTEREDGRKGRKMPRKDENVVLTNYVHTILLQLQKEMKLDRTTYNKLGERLFFGEQHSLRLKGSVRATFKDFLTEKKIPSVWTYADWYFESRARKEIELALDQLQKQDKITVEKFCVGNFNRVDENGKVTTFIKRIDSEQALRIQQAISKVVEENGLSYTEYKKQLAFPYQSKKLLETQEEVQQHLNWNFGINYMYGAINITILETKPSEVVQFRKAQETFLNKTLGLVKGIKDSPKYRKSKRKSEKFYYLCVLLYVKAMGITVDKNELEDEISKIPIYLEEIVESYYQQQLPVGFIHNENTLES